MKKKTFALFFVVIMVLAVAAPAFAAPRQFGTLFYDGQVVRTHKVQAAVPHGGRDALYVFTDTMADGQLPITAVAPGDQDYHGGEWAFNSVTWNVAPYLIDSDGDLLDAAANGDVTITRVMENDFRCPIHP